MKTAEKYFVIIACVIFIGGAYFFPKLPSRPDVPVGALPVYQKFQLLKPMGYGSVMSDGISTTTLIASTSPWTASVNATSTTATSTLQGVTLATSGGSVGIATTSPGNAAKLGIFGALFVGGQATSTFTNGINITGNGCFAVNGTCLGGGSGSGSTFATSYASTSIPNGIYKAFWNYPSTLAAGKQIIIPFSMCNRADTGGGTIYYLLANSSQGTTTVSKWTGGTTANWWEVNMSGMYPPYGAATTTETNIRFSISNDGTSILDSTTCGTFMNFYAYTPN